MYYVCGVVEPALASQITYSLNTEIRSCRNRDYTGTPLTPWLQQIRAHYPDLIRTTTTNTQHDASLLQQPRLKEWAPAHRQH